MPATAIIETYTVTEDDLFFELGGTITDALSGIRHAVSRDGKLKVALNVPLAACCDAPVELCACLAPVIHLGIGKVAA